MTTRTKPRRRLSEASAERMIDKLLRERLATDRAYKNAASNLQAQDREDVVARELTDYVYGTYEVA